jgi:hypothetical protein
MIEAQQGTILAIREFECGNFLANFGKCEDNVSNRFLIAATLGSDELLNFINVFMRSKATSC